MPERLPLPQQIAALPQHGLIAIVRAYRLLFSPWVGSACRFTPTCSAYAIEALEQHGALFGSILTTRRLLRCHPWCAGGLDPVPPPRGAGPTHSSRQTKR
jgi:putative membrane protein insertion efficiency factor